MRSDDEPTSVGDRREEQGSALRTFLIADVRGYTRFTHERGDEGAAELAVRFAALARRGITGRGGELVELRGDEALAVFGSARDALRAAVDLQRLFRAGTEDEPGLPLGVGIGIDAGEAVAVEGGYRGGALNLAARLCSRAAAGEILASETVVSLARHIDGLRLIPRGRAQLKGLEDPIDIFEVVPEEVLPKLPLTRLAPLRRFRRRHVTRRNTLAAGLIVLTAAAVSTAALAVGPGGDIISGAAEATKVGLVLPRVPAGSEDVYAPYRQGLLEAERTYGLDAQVIVDNAAKPLSGELRERLGDFDLLLVAGPTAQTRLAPEIPRNPETRIVYLDTQGSVDVDQAARNPNFSDIYFAFGPAAYEAGYLSVLMAMRSAPNGSGRPVVSVIAVAPPLPGDEDGLPPWHETPFIVGAKAADKRAVVLVDHAGRENVANPLVCAKLAHRQIDRGSRVVFAAAGACGLGALSAAELRGVWGVGADVDRSYLGPHILVSAVKRTDRAIEYAITGYLDGTLHQGTLDVGLAQDAIGIVGVNSAVPADVRAKLAQEVERMSGFFAELTEPKDE